MASKPSNRALAELDERVSRCRKCPRLVAWREQVAREKVRRFLDWEYWGRPVPGFGPANARLLIVGLAPAAHGGNRTGRMFTGDSSGDWLYEALYAFGFANQATSTSRDDGLELIDCRIAAAARCAPPDNKPTREELETCRPWLLEEMGLLPDVQVVVALGRIGFDAVRRARYAVRGAAFAHGAEWKAPDGTFLISSYQPSQQNTNTV